MIMSAERLAANQRNARKSTGPRTEAGKSVSRGNSLKHGLTGAGIVLPEDGAAKVDRLNATLLSEIRPKTEIGKIMIRKVAVMAHRFDESVRFEQAVIATNTRIAAEEYDDARMRELEEILAGLGDHPAETVALLEQCPEGVQFLRQSWLDLMGVISSPDPEAWKEEHWSLFDHLSGRTADPNRDRPREGLHRQATIQFIALERLLAGFDLAKIDRERQTAIDLALFDDAPEVLLARRYELANDRMLHKALKAIDRAEGTKLASNPVAGSRDEAATSDPVGSFSSTLPSEYFPAAEDLAILDWLAPETLDDGEPGLEAPRSRSDRPDPARMREPMPRQ